jgi:hypothetical protein
MVTKEKVEKAKAAAVAADAAADALAVDVEAAENNANAAWGKYNKLKRERGRSSKMVTKKEVEKAKAEWVAVYDYSYSSWKTALTADVFLETAVAAYVAYDRYLKLRQEFENGK